eukprot:585144-Amphidinium_carterae.1
MLAFFLLKSPTVRAMRGGPQEGQRERAATAGDTPVPHRWGRSWNSKMQKLDLRRRHGVSSGHMQLSLGCLGTCHAMAMALLKAAQAMGDLVSLLAEALLARGRQAKL